MISYVCLQGDVAIHHMLSGEVAGEPVEGQRTAPAIKCLPEYLPQVSHGSGHCARHPACLPPLVDRLAVNVHNNVPWGQC